MVLYCQGENILSDLLYCIISAIIICHQKQTLILVDFRITPHLTDRHLTDRLNVQSILDRTDIFGMIGLVCQVWLGRFDLV